jgi:DNA-binding NarL/FixJ family response regulator
MARSDLASIGRELHWRECELLCALGAGFVYGEIANDFDVSPATLRVRAVRLRSRLLRVVAVQSRT